MNETFRPPRPLSPAGSLLHPVWWGALVLLAANDHVLKGSGLLPSGITGKLSDFAGLLVAPALLAVFARVRTERGWFACHLAVGFVFAAIQLSASFAAMWSQAMGWFGHPWTIVCDPTDLFALPMLWVSHRWLLADTPGQARTFGRRSLQLGGAAVGLWCCVATSYEGPPDDPNDQEFFGVHLRNDTARPLVVRLQPLAATTSIDCDIVALDPGGLLGPELFDTVQSWTLEPEAGLELAEVLMFADEECSVLRFESDGFPPSVLFWTPDVPVPTSIALSEEDTRGTITSERVVVYPIEDSPAPTEACAIPGDLQRIDQGELPLGTHILGEVEPGIDGCVLLGFGDGEAIASRTHLCLPEGTFPFAVGDRVSVLPRTDEFGLPAGGEIKLLGPDDNQPGGVELVLWRGGNPSIEGLEVVARPLHECGLVIESSCDTVGTPMSVEIRGAGPNPLSLNAGERITATDETTRTAFDVHLLRATDRVALETECAMGPDAGSDIELVVVRRTLDR